MSNPIDWNDDRGAIDHNILENFGLNFPPNLFFTVVFVIVIITYFLYLLFYPDQTPPIQTRRVPQTLPSPQGLDPEMIKKLQIILHQAPSDLDDASECCICLSAFRNGEKLKVLPGCDHRFHCECVDDWLQNRTSCPLCRASLTLHNSSFSTILIQEPPIRHP